VAPGTEGVDRKYWGIGVRIEDDVLVTDGDPRVLTSGVPKKVSEIEALMSSRA
jgi:Xaa-Pro aminopeptidase